MNANEVIESYVTDVALRLPRKLRNDVAFELRALLSEELQGRAEAAGREPDAAMATELVLAFGRPGDVAARYRPTLTIIDPADGQGFLRATVIGLGIIWGLGLLAQLRQPIDSGWDLLSVLGRWWGGSVIPSLWWPGLLVVGFGLSAWARRRWPQAGEWKPRAEDHIPGNRVGLVLGIVGIVCGVYVLLEPTWLLDLFWGGKAAPAAYDALTYTDSFRQRQAPWILLLLLLNIPMFLVMIVQGRCSATMRRFELVHSLALCAVLAWTVLDGPVFMTSVSDKTTKAFLVLITVVTLVHLGISRYRRVRPAPD